MAVKRGFKNAEGNYEADFIPCVVWEKKAEVIADHVKKGHQFGVSGRVQVRTYDNKDGQKVWITEVVVEDFDFLESKRDSAGNPPAVTKGSFGHEVSFDDDTIPF